MLTVGFNKGKLAWIGLFAGLLGYFIATNSWHEYSEIAFKGTSYDGTQAIFSWDSGSGFNDMESVTVDIGLSSEKNLKTKITQPGIFNVYLRLPFYDIKQIRLSGAKECKFQIDHIEIQSKYGTIPILGFLQEAGTELIISNLSRNTKKYFNPVRFVQQICFAALLTYLLFSVLRLKIRIGSWKAFFFGGKRAYFWGMFLVSTGIFSSWLMTFWPAYITADSIDIWRAAKIPGYFINFHPVLNVIYYRFLQHIWDHFAIVSIVQILLSGLLGSYIFYCLLKDGVHFYLLLPFFMIFVGSVSVATYNITLWKDVPFALSVVLWAFLLARMVHAKKSGHEPSFNVEKWLLLGALLLAVSFFRHNGIIYLLFIPMGMCAIGVLRVRKNIVPLIIGAFVVVGIILLLSSSMINRTGFLKKQTALLFNIVKNISLQKTSLRVINQYDDLLDIKKNREKSDFWNWNSVSNRWHKDYIRRIKYHDYIRYIKFKPIIAAAYEPYKKIVSDSIKVPWIWFAWNPRPVLFLFLTCIIGFRYFPRSAIYAYVPIIQAVILLVLLKNLNWRYYYFLYFSSLFLIPVCILDLKPLVKRVFYKKSIQSP